MYDRFVTNYTGKFNAYVQIEIGAKPRTSLGPLLTTIIVDTHAHTVTHTRGTHRYTSGSPDGTDDVFPLVVRYGRMGLGVLVHEPQERDGPHGADGAEHVEDGRPTAGEPVLGQHAAERHRYYRPELSTCGKPSMTHRSRHTAGQTTLKRPRRRRVLPCTRSQYRAVWFSSYARFDAPGSPIARPPGPFSVGFLARSFVGSRWQRTRPIRTLADVRSKNAKRAQRTQSGKMSEKRCRQNTERTKTVCVTGKSASSGPVGRTKRKFGTPTSHA